MPKDKQLDDDSFCIVFDAESDILVPNYSPDIRDLHIKRYMQFTVLCALKIPSMEIRSEIGVDDVIRASQPLFWWRDVAEKECSPVEELLLLFDEADFIIGYNCLAFDFPLIHRFYSMSSKKSVSPEQRYIDHRSKCLDVMLRFKEATSQYFKLDKLLKLNGLTQKNGCGKTAVELWQQGNRGVLQEYCANDVEVTARLALTETVKVGDGLVVSYAHSIQCALASQRAHRTVKRLRSADVEDDYVMV